MQSRAVAAARSVCARAPGVGWGRPRADVEARRRDALGKCEERARGGGWRRRRRLSAILKPRARGKHLDRPWH